MLKRRLLALHEACSHDAQSKVCVFFVFVGGSVVLSRLYRNDVACLCSDGLLQKRACCPSGFSGRPSIFRMHHRLPGKGPCLRKLTFTVCESQAQARSSSCVVGFKMP